MSSLSLHTALPGAGRHWWPPPWCTTPETQYFPVPWLRDSGHWDANFSREETLAWGLERTQEATLETELPGKVPVVCLTAEKHSELLFTICWHWLHTPRGCNSFRSQY
ncbi:hypothetical protein LEMLEM_LOCUS23717 [Lemmus lemmus]